MTFVPSVTAGKLSLGMPGSFKTEAVVLRSIRLGEADRVLHLYSAERGRIGAVAKGVRRVRSRFGGRLEPMFRVGLVLHEGRGELCTVTAAETVHAHASLRERRPSLERAAQACDAVLRLFDSEEPNRPAYNLLCQELVLLDDDPRAATRAQALAFRLKLLLAAGFLPELAACATCGDPEHLGAFSAAAGGVVCAGCEAGSFPLEEAAHTFMVDALARPLADAPQAPEPALRQADRAIAETLEHHAHVRLRRVAA
jgi:DNA repair protein RecO (recombination protein O)